MRIASLDPFITELVCFFGQEEKLVGISHCCDFPEQVTHLPRLTETYGANAKSSPLSSKLSSVGSVLFQELKKVQPDLLLGSMPNTLNLNKQDYSRIVKETEQELQQELGPSTTFRSWSPSNLESVFECFEEVAAQVNSASKGKALVQRVKAQIMDWGDNFYERMRNKRVSFISGLPELTLAGTWLPDIIAMCSCICQNPLPGLPDKVTSIEELQKFRPDVVIIAPRGKDLNQSLRTFKLLEESSSWGEVLAVKRGEVFFCDGILTYRPGPRLIESIAIVVSALAGLESGYICKRDSFFRLRWLELHRHKF